MFETHRLLYHSTLGLGVIKKKESFRRTDSQRHRWLLSAGLYLRVGLVLEPFRTFRGRFMLGAAVERRGNISIVFTYFHLENGSSQGQKLALTGFCFPSSLDSGLGPCRSEEIQLSQPLTPSTLNPKV